MAPGGRRGRVTLKHTPNEMETRHTVESTEAERRAAESAMPEPLAWGLTLLSLAAGAVLVARLDRTGMTAGILLFVAGLGFLAVALGSRPYGSDVEGPLDLSSSLALGLLGGVLGALANTAVVWLFGSAGIPQSVGVAISSEMTGLDWAARAWYGGLWGVALGVLLPVVPGRGAVARGAVFSLLPTFYMWFKVFPLDRGAGFFGLELGLLTPLFVMLFNLVWGAVAGGVLRWGQRTDEGPVSRYLGVSA